MYFGAVWNPSTSATAQPIDSRLGNVSCAVAQWVVLAGSELPLLRVRRVVDSTVHVRGVLHGPEGLYRTQPELADEIQVQLHVWVR